MLKNLDKKGLFNTKGFTLVELLVVITIIGVLATLVLLQLGTARAKARDAKRISDINQLRTAIELFYDDNNGRYPVNPLTTAQLGVYFSSPTLPTDPVTGVNYFYGHGPAANPIQYHLWIELERNNPGALRGDSDIDSSLWAAGDRGDYNDAADEMCQAAYAAGAARDCIYDTGQQ